MHYFSIVNFNKFSVAEMWKKLYIFCFSVLIVLLELKFHKIYENSIIQISIKGLIQSKLWWIHKSNIFFNWSQLDNSKKV